MKKLSFSDIACVVIFAICLVGSVCMVIESGNPDLPLWLTRMMRWVGLFCIAVYSYVVGAVVEDIKFGQYDE